MRVAILVAAVAIVTMAVPPARAQEYPWCAHYAMMGGPQNCGFTTLEQCRMTISGVGGVCMHNPFYAAAQAAPGQSRRTKPINR